MNHGLLGIEFTETMSGYFHWGATEPTDGAVRGRARGSVLTVDNLISIADVEGFCSPQQVPAVLEATVDLRAPDGPLADSEGSVRPPTIQRVDADLGTFQLFVPAAFARLMIYRFGLSLAGEPYYFQGIKTLYGESSVRRLWHQSTHLHVRLHRGRDPSGPVVGAGVLTIGALGTLAMARSTRTVGVGSLLDRARALARYNQFSARGFWQALRQGPMSPALKRRPV